MKTLQTSLFLAFIAPVTFPVYADQPLDQVSVTTGQGIQAENVYSQPKSFTNNSQTFKREDFQKLPITNAYEMLDYATGAFIQTQGRKSPYFASTRAGSNLGIIIDGAFLPPPAASKVLMQLPVSAIESMKIVRDASALNLGPLTSIIGPMTSSRTEGFIVIKTLSAFKQPKSELHAKVGTYDQLEVDGTTAYQFNDKVAGRLVLAHQQKQGPDDYYNDYQRNVGLWKLEGFHDQFDWQINFFHSDGEQSLQRGLATSGVSDAKWKYDPMSVRMINAQAGYYWDSNNTTAVRFAHSQSDADLNQYSHSNPMAYKLEVTEENFSNFDLSHAIQSEWFEGENLLRFGYNWMHYDNPTGMLYYPGFAREEQIHSLYLQNEFQRDVWSMDFGLRSDTRQIDKGYEQIGKQRRIIENVELDSLITAAFGGSNQFSQNDLLSLRTLYTEQQPVSVYTSNNEQLQQEQRIRSELGWNHQWFQNSTGRLETTITAFHEKLKNGAYVASQIPDPEEADSFINVYDNASWRNRGVELEIKGRMAEFGYELALSKVKPGDTPSGVMNVPERLIKARLYYNTPSWQFDLGARSMSDYLSANKAGSGIAGDFVTYDAAIGYKTKSDDLNHHWLFSIKNLTDKKYETIYGFPSEGINYGVDYRVQF